MLNLSARTRVRELEAGSTLLIDMLTALGLYRPGDDTELMLGELCFRRGFNTGILLMMLRSSHPPVQEKTIDVAPFERMPLGELVDHIESVHHARLRRELPRLVELTAEAAAHDPAKVELHEEMARIASELEAHIGHEEESLFRMVRDLCAGANVAPTRCGSAVGGPIACMENDHVVTTRALHRLGSLTGNYAVDDGSDDAHRTLMTELAAFAEDLRVHMTKEDKVLFPRALRAERAARAGIRTMPTADVSAG